jgi:hypothetical protein
MPLLPPGIDDKLEEIYSLKDQLLESWSFLSGRYKQEFTNFNTSFIQALNSPNTLTGEYLDKCIGILNRLLQKAKLEEIMGLQDEVAGKLIKLKPEHREYYKNLNRDFNQRLNSPSTLDINYLTSRINYLKLIIQKTAPVSTSGFGKSSRSVKGGRSVHDDIKYLLRL